MSDTLDLVSLILINHSQEETRQSGLQVNLIDDVSIRLVGLACYWFQNEPTDWSIASSCPVVIGLLVRAVVATSAPKNSAISLNIVNEVENEVSSTESGLANSSIVEVESVGSHLLLKLAEVAVDIPFLSEREVEHAPENINRRPIDGALGTANSKASYRLLSLDFELISLVLYQNTPIRVAVHDIL